MPAKRELTMRQLRYMLRLLRALSRVKLLILDDWGPETLSHATSSRPP
jgi:DNA replication protein DnaC